MKATAQMGGLTREEIEVMRTNVKGAVTNLWADASGRRIMHDKVDALCDLALKSLSIESVRSEALRDAEKVCEEYGANCLKNAAQPGVGADIQDMWRDMNLAATRIAERIRALSPARVAEEKDVHSSKLT